LDVGNETTPSVDPSGQLLGIELINAGGGDAEFAVTVREDMTNGHGMCHGGMIFLLGDTAMDYAVNTGNPLSVAVHAEIDFVSPAHVGDRLHAVAHVRDSWGRARLIDATITNEATGQVVAHFRGRTREIGR